MTSISSGGGFDFSANMMSSSSNPALQAVAQARAITEEATASSTLAQAQNSATNIEMTTLNAMSQQDGNVAVEIARTATSANMERQKGVAKTLENASRLT
jgi:hypothetical protein